MADKHYGTVPNSEQRKMSGLAFVQGLVDGSQPLNTMAKVLDYDVVEAEVGQVVITAAPTREHLRRRGTVGRSPGRSFMTARDSPPRW